MPSLKDLTCSIELSDDPEPLQELGTVYGDAFVETFVPVPRKQQTFTVHLRSNNFIAPGIAMYVFIDGIYQCNRNRQNMKLRKPPDRRSLVDFKVRQKEEKQKDGSMVARDWTFEKLDHASADDAPDSCSPNILDNIGCIEVVVLRCAGPRNAKTAANMNLDGATDFPNYGFDRDSRSRRIDVRSAYDDRDPFVSTASNRHGPPPPVSSYRSPYAETVRSREGMAMQHRHSSTGGQGLSPSASKDPSRRAYSRYTEPVSPGTRPRRDIPAPGFQYGSGPLPSRSRAETYRESMERQPSAPAVDPVLLEKLVTDAVERGVAKSKKNDMSDGGHTDRWRHDNDVETSSHVPGAWPASPVHPAKHHPSRSRAATHVTWDEESDWDEQSRVEGWGSRDSNAPDSWDTEETWSRKKPNGWDEVRRRSRSRTRTNYGASPSRRASHTSNRVSGSRHSKHGRSEHRRSRSRIRVQKSQWVENPQSSSEDNDGWTHVEASSDSTTSLERSDSTLKPSHSRSQVRTSRSRSTRQPSRRKLSQDRHERKTPQRIENPQWHAESVHHARPASILLTNAPTSITVPIPQSPIAIPSQRSSLRTQPAPSIVAPPPTWGCGSSEKARKNSVATTYLPPPAPFSTVGNDRDKSRHSSSSSSWEVASKPVLKSGSKSSPQQSTWGGGDKKSEKAQGTWGADDWSEDQAKGWGDDVVEEKNGGWEDTGGWVGTGGDKEAAVDGWDTNENDNWNPDSTAVDAWNTDSKDTTKEEQANPAAFEAWDTTDWDAAKATDTAWHQQNNPANDIPSNDAGDLWTAAAAAAPAPSERHPSTPTKPKTPRLSPPLLKPSPHWSFPPPSSKYTPRPTAFSKKRLSHHVLAGPGTQYGHPIGRPEYVDRLDKPYAVFRFKYRSRGVLREMFGKACLGKDRDGGLAREEGEEDGARRLTEEWVRGQSRGEM